MSFDNINSGAAFPNDKRMSVRSPDFKGSLNVEGKEYWLSVWVKIAGPSSKNPGQKFLSLSINPKEEIKTWDRAEDDPLAGFGETDDPNKPSNATDLPEPKFRDIPKDDNFSF